jgi:hypothetical protein
LLDGTVAFGAPTDSVTGDAGPVDDAGNVCGFVANVAAWVDCTGGGEVLGVVLGCVVGFGDDVAVRVGVTECVGVGGALVSVRQPSPVHGEPDTPAGAVEPALGEPDAVGAAPSLPRAAAPDADADAASPTKGGRTRNVDATANAGSQARARRTTPPSRPSHAERAPHASAATKH